VGESRTMGPQSYVPFVPFLFRRKDTRDGRLRPFSASAGNRPGIYAGLAELGATFVPLLHAVNPVHGVPAQNGGLNLRNAIEPVNELPGRVLAGLILSSFGSWNIPGGRRLVNQPYNGRRVAIRHKPGINAGPITG